MPRTPSKTKTLQPVDANAQRGAATPGTKMRHLKEELQNKETENETLRGNIEELTKVIGKLDFIKDSASVSVAPKDEKKGKDKKAPVVPAKTAYKFFCESQKKQDNMQQVWKECAPEIRQKYQLLAKADKERYQSEMEAHNQEQKALEMYNEKKKQEQAMAFYEAHLEAQALLEKVQDENGKNKKKKKAAKDPDAPKRCTSSYMFFAQEMRAEVVKKNPNAKVTEVSKILGEMWKDLDEKKKTPYEDMAAKDRERYNKEKEAYDAKLAERKEEQEKEAAARFEQERKEAMEFMESQSVQVPHISVKNGADNVSVMTDNTSKPVKKKKDPNAPKRALTAYNYFVKENRDGIKAKMPEKTTNGELLTEIGKQWKELSDAKKKKYNKMSAKDQERYAKEMEQYNATKN